MRRLKDYDWKRRLLLLNRQGSRLNIRDRERKKKLLLKNSGYNMLRRKNKGGKWKLRQKLIDLR